jgi:hypothetical protein
LTVYLLPARIEGEGAAKHFARRRFRNGFGLLAPSIRVAAAGTPSTRIPPFVERIWMPAYAICLRTISSKGGQDVWTSVEGISGTFSLFECVDELASCELDEDSFPPIIDEAAASELARHGLLRYIMSQRGQIDKPVVQAVMEVRPYHFPVWVYYFHRYSKQRIDLKVFDAYSGKSAGAKMRVSVLNALIAAKKSMSVSLPPGGIAPP